MKFPKFGQGKTKLPRITGAIERQPIANVQQFEAKRDRTTSIIIGLLTIATFLSVANILLVFLASSRVATDTFVADGTVFGCEVFSLEFQGETS